MATYDVTDQTSVRRVQFTGDGTAGPFAFAFQVNATNQIKVYVDATVKTESSHYTVSLNSGTGAGTVSFTSGNFPTSSQTITLLGSIPLSRTSVYTSGGQLTSASLEDDFDTNMFVHQQTNEEVNRSLRLAEHDTVSGADMTLPAKADRLGKLLGFNSSTGNPEASFTVADGTTLSNIASDIATLADIEDGTDATDAIQTVAGIAGNVTTVAGISANVTTVAGKASEITALSASSVIADMALLGTSDVVADMALLANADVIADMNTLATTDIVSDLNTLATSDIVSDLNTLATSDIVSDINTLATSDIVSDLNTLATSDIVTDLNLLATSDNVTNMATLGASGVVGNIATVAGANSNISTVAGISSNVTTVAGISSNVTTVATNISTINSVASTVGGSKTYTVTVTNPGSGNVFVLDSSNNPAITLTRGFTYIFDLSDSSNTGHPLAFKNGSSSYTDGVTTTGTAGQAGAKVTFVVPDDAPATGLLYYCTVHGNSMGNTITTATNDIATVVANLDAVNGFASRYRIASSAPTDSLDAGDLYFNTSTNVLNYYNGSSFQAIVAGAMTSLAVDTTPQLGGDLDVVTHSIVSTSNRDINITPNGSGKVVLDGLSYPTADGTNGQVITTNGSGALSFGTVDLSVKANIASPTFTGTPLAPTASAGTNTTQLATTAFVTTAVANAEPFPSGTSMLFQQTSAPTGWTKQTTHNDKALRIVTGTVGTGGSVAFSTALGSGATVAGGTVSGSPDGSNLSVSMSGNISNTTLSTSQIPSHSHSLQIFAPYYNTGGVAGYNGPSQGNINTANTGGGGSHNHGHNLSGSLSGNIGAGNLAVGASTASINVNYVDFIIANKD